MRALRPPVLRLVKKPAAADVLIPTSQVFCHLQPPPAFTGSTARGGGSTTQLWKAGYLAVLLPPPELPQLQVLHIGDFLGELGGRGRLNPELSWGPWFLQFLVPQGLPTLLSAAAKSQGGELGGKRCHRLPWSR